MTIYRQHRPTQFKDLIGQNQARNILQQAILKDRVTHAYLFSGPRGTGKTSTARVFARTLCCTSPVATASTIEACGTCQNCIAITGGHTADLLEIDAASNRGIEEMRTLREQAQYGPIQLPRKIYIVDEVHMLTNEAFNSLLKTLEEPPSHCLFILATTDIHKLPATVRSRCQLIRFERASNESIIAKLEKITRANTLKVDAPVLQVIAAAADGSFRDAETILEQLTTQHTHVTIPLAEEALGTVSATHISQLTTAVLTGNSDEASTILSEHFSDQSLRYSWIIQEVITEVKSSPKLEGSHLTFLKNLLEAHVLQKSSPVQNLPLTIACLESAQAIAGSPHITPTLAKPTTPTKKSTHEPAPRSESSAPQVLSVKPTSTPPPAAASVPVVELREAAEVPASVDVRKAWKTCCEAIAVVNYPISQLLRQTVFHVAEANTITIYVKYKFHADKLSEKKNLHLVQDTLKEATGFTFTVRYLVNHSIPKPEPKRQITGSQNSGSTPPPDLTPGNVASVFSPASS